MKFSDFILDKIIETDLFNLAFRRKRVLDKCSELSWEICKNIIELCCFEKSDTKEILESINDCLYEIENLMLKLIDNTIINTNSIVKVYFMDSKYLCISDNTNQTLTFILKNPIDKEDEKDAMRLIFNQIQDNNLFEINIDKIMSVFDVSRDID